MTQDAEDTRIPLNTLARIFEVAVFEHDDTRITEQALELSSEYLRMFVREALLRANEDRENPKDGDNLKNGTNIVQNQLIGDVLDTQHLENIAGLLVLDF
jgi:hypothetical protein